MTNSSIIEKALDCRDLVADVVREIIGSVSKCNDLAYTALSDEWVRVRVRGPEVSDSWLAIHEELLTRYDKEIRLDPADPPNVVTFRFRV